MTARCSLPILIAASCLYAAAAAQAQTSSTAPADAAATAAKGKVIGPADQPKAGVPVAIQGSQGKTVAVTDANGTWSLYNLPAGTYTAQVLHAQNKDTKPVSFTIKEKSFWDRLTGSDKEIVSAPALKMPNVAE
jgi:uncharacterized protein (DUF2141 family)